MKYLVLNETDADNYYPTEESAMHVRDALNATLAHDRYVVVTVLELNDQTDINDQKRWSILAAVEGYMCGIGCHKHAKSLREYLDTLL